VTLARIPSRPTTWNGRAIVKVHTSMKCRVASSRTVAIVSPDSATAGIPCGHYLLLGDELMGKFTRLLVGACVTIVALTTFAGPALALRSLQASSPGAGSGTGANVSFEEEGRFVRGVCAGVTLNGEANERVAKIVGAPVGQITEGRATGCTAFGAGTTVTIEASAATPWRVTYNSILGTLPTITGGLLLTEGIRFTMVGSGRTCRYEGRSGFLAPVTREARGHLTFEGGSMLPEPKIRILAGSTLGCPAESSLRGSVRFERTRTVTLV
jgi:hypothetical protein